MEDSIKANGVTIIWKASVFIHGKMVESMRVSIKMIRNMDMAFTYGLINESMKDGGIEENSMDWVSILCPMKSQSMVYGKMGKE